MLERTPVFDVGKKVANVAEGKEVDINKEELFPLEQTSFFYTRAPGHYQLRPRSKLLNDQSVVEQADDLWWKRPSFSDAIDDVDYDVPGKVRTTQCGWTNLMSNIPRSPQEEHLYKEICGIWSYMIVLGPYLSKSLVYLSGRKTNL